MYSHQQVGKETQHTDNTADQHVCLRWTVTSNLVKIQNKAHEQHRRLARLSMMYSHQQVGKEMQFRATVPTTFPRETRPRPVLQAVQAYSCRAEYRRSSFLIMIMTGNLWRSISWEPRALTKADKHTHFKKHTHTRTNTHTQTPPHRHTCTHTHTHTHTHGKNTCIVVMGLIETEERKR